MLTADEILALVRGAKVNELFELNAAIFKELRERKIIRSTNAPSGDYAELLFARAFSWTLQGNANSAYDAIDAAGKRYQIKSRRLTAERGTGASRQLSCLRRLPDKTFHFLAAVLFNADYSIRRAAIVPHNLLEPRSRFSRHVNGWIFFLNDDVWTLPGVRDVTNEIRASAAALATPESGNDADRAELF